MSELRIAHTSVSKSLVSIRLISSFGIRASKSSAKGRGCKLAVWVNACVSIGDPSTSFRRKAHNTKAVVINSDLYVCSVKGVHRERSVQTYSLAVVQGKLYVQDETMSFG